MTGSDHEERDAGELERGLELIAEALLERAVEGALDAVETPGLRRVPEPDR